MKTDKKVVFFAFLLSFMASSFIQNSTAASNRFLDLEETNEIYADQADVLEPYALLNCPEGMNIECIADGAISKLPEELNADNLRIIKRIAYSSIKFLKAEDLQKLADMLAEYEEQGIEVTPEKKYHPRYLISIEEFQKQINETRSTTPQERIRSVKGSKFEKSRKGRMQNSKNRRRPTCKYDESGEQSEGRQAYCESLIQGRQEAETAKEEGNLKAFFEWYLTRARMAISAHHPEDRGRDYALKLYEYFPEMSNYYENNTEYYDGQHYDCIAQKVAHYLLLNGEIEKAKELAYSHQCRGYYNPFVRAVMTSEYTGDPKLVDRLYELFIDEAEADKTQISKSNHNTISVALMYEKYDSLQKRIKEGLGENEIRPSLSRQNAQYLLTAYLFDDGAKKAFQGHEETLWNIYFRSCLKKQISDKRMGNQADPFVCYENFLNDAWSELPYRER